MNKLAFPVGLYGITPEWNDTNKLLYAIEQAAKGGMVALQWRRKHIDPNDIKKQALAVVKCCADLGIISIINDNYMLALYTNADGVHLGKDDSSVTEARNILGNDKIIGVSCYNDITLAAQMLSLGVDYVAFGSMYPSRTKPDAVHANIDILSSAKKIVRQQFSNNTSKKPAIVAIGGINVDNINELIDAGVDAVAVIQALFNADNIKSTAQSFNHAFNAKYQKT